MLASLMITLSFPKAKNAALVTLNSALISACSSKVFDTDIAFYGEFNRTSNFIIS